MKNQLSGYNNVDLNGRTHTGFMIAQTTSRNGSRLSTARAFLRPARNRPNLHVMLNSTATRILFDQNKQAVGVEFVHNDQLHRVNVLKEVIVSGGTKPTYFIIILLHKRFGNLQKFMP